MRVRFRFVRPFRDAIGKSEIELLLDDGALPQALAALVRAYPGLREHLYEGDGLSSYVNIYVNGQPVPIGAADATSLREGDEVVFLLPLTGG